MLVTSGGGWERGATGVCLLLVFVHIPPVVSFGIPEFLEFGQCEDVYVDPNMNFERYSGIWFVTEDVPNEYSPVDACSFTNYTWQGDFMTTEERGLNSEGEKVRKNSLMRPTEGQPGVLTVEAEGVPRAPYQIVSTDFDNYACVHSCFSMMGFRASFSWILARVPTPNQSYVALCRDVLEKHGIDPNSMEVVRQGKDCPYMEKLDSLLAYTRSLQKKVKIRAQDEIQSVKHTTAEGEATQEELDDEATQGTPRAPTQGPQQTSTSDSQDGIRDEEELLRDPGREALAEEQEEERQELREEVNHEHHHDPTTGERATPVSGGDSIHLSVIKVSLTAAAIFVTSQM